MVELRDRRQVPLDLRPRVEKHRERGEPDPAGEGHEQGRLVLAIAESGLLHRGGRPRLIAPHA
jgi:hypothetical protein